MKKLYILIDEEGQKKSWKVILAAGRHFIHAGVGLRNEAQIHCDVIPGQNFEGSVNLDKSRIIDIEHSR